MLCPVQEGDVQGQDGNPGEALGVLIDELLPLGSSFMWMVDRAELSPWSCGQWGPFGYAKRPAELAGLSKQGLSPSSYPELGRNTKPRPLLAIRGKKKIQTK